MSRFTVDDSSDVSVERFLFERDPDDRDSLVVTDTHPPYDVAEYLADEHSLYVTS